MECARAGNQESTTLEYEHIRLRVPIQSPPRPRRRPGVRREFVDESWLSSSGVALALGPGPADRIVREAGNDVPVAVVDGLASDAADVDDDIEPLGARRRLDGAAESGKQRARGGGKLLGQFAKLGMMRTRNE